MNISAFFDYCYYEEHSKRAMKFYVATHNWRYWQAWKLAYKNMKNKKNIFDKETVI